MLLKVLASSRSCSAYAHLALQPMQTPHLATPRSAQWPPFMLSFPRHADEPTPGGAWYTYRVSQHLGVFACRKRKRRLFLNASKASATSCPLLCSCGSMLSTP